MSTKQIVIVTAILSLFCLIGSAVGSMAGFLIVASVL